MDSFNLSFEFFPPKTERGSEKLSQTSQKLASLNPQFFSCTYGAGGSTRDRTKDAISLLASSGVNAAPHLSCIGATRSELKEILNQYQQQGVDRIVALRGDLPSGMGLGGAGELAYANQLVEFIREETGDHFHIEVAAYPEMHPQAKNFESDLDNFERKVKAGANSAITQYFYNPDSYYYFLDRCQERQIDIPIIPGIMPITNFTNLVRFSDACGAEIPRWIRKQLEAYGDDLASIKMFGEEVVTQLCEDLMDNDVPGLHFYTLNQAEPSCAIWENLTGTQGDQ